MITKRNKKRLINSNFQQDSLYILYRYHQHFFQSLIFRGRKLWAFNFFIRIKLELKLDEEMDPLLVFFLGITAITPEILMFPFKLGGIVNYVAMPISLRKQIIFATKWVIKLIRDKFKLVSLDSIAAALLDALYYENISVQRKLTDEAVAINNRYLTKYFK